MPFDSLPITSPVIEKLRLGRARIAMQRGLARGTLVDHEGNACAIAAISEHINTLDAVETQALVYIAKAIPAVPLAISAWNDEPGRTKEEVVEVYDRALELALIDVMAER